MIVPWPRRAKRRPAERTARFVLIDKHGNAVTDKCPFAERNGLAQVLDLGNELDARRWAKEWNASRILPLRGA